MNRLLERVYTLVAIPGETESQRHQKAIGLVALFVGIPMTTISIVAQTASWMLAIVGALRESWESNRQEPSASNRSV